MFQVEAKRALVEANKKREPPKRFPFFDRFRSSLRVSWPSKHFSLSLPFLLRRAQSPWGARGIFARGVSVNRFYKESVIRKDLFVLLRRDDLLAAIEAGRADVMTAMDFAGRRFDSRRRILQEVMSTAIAATGDRFLILLNSHG